MQKERVCICIQSMVPHDELQGLCGRKWLCILPATDFHRKFESNDIKMHILPGLGFEGSAFK